MVRRWSLLAATSLLIACPSSAPRPVGPAPTPDIPLRIRVAQAEARRAGGTAELIELASRGDKPQRVLALRGLGRIGTIGAPGAPGAPAPTGAADPTGPASPPRAAAAPAISALIAALGDRDPEIVGAAAMALGVAASLDDSELGVTAALLAALPRGGAPVIEALGRAGTAEAHAALAAALGDPRLAATAGLALGRHGRRKIEISVSARGALAVATGSSDPAVRYAAVYAMAREFLPHSDPAATAALVQRLRDPLSEIRAQAIAGLGRRKAIAAARGMGARLDALLLDRDWRVAVEAVRALGDSDDGKDAIAAVLLRRYGELERGDATMAQVIIEGEKALAGAGQRPVVAAALAALATREPVAAVPALARGWIECLAIAGRLRAEPDPAFAALENCGLADRLRLPLVAELLAAKVGSPAARRAALARLLGHTEPRVRAAGLGALAAQWTTGDASDRRDAMAALVAALAGPDLSIAAAAVEAAGAVYAAIGVADHGWLDAAVIARAGAERDPELGAALLELIGKRSLAAGAPACRAALGGDPVRAKAAASCLTALGEPVPTSTAAAASPPPVDVASVIGKPLRWRVMTSRGELVIRLHPEVAPWAVAAIVELTRKGFYDGLEFHRVVGNFVVQGGDPTESGSGGPGFALPAEPGALGDGAGYTAGGVGIADAGRDSGGSQWFVMHSRAPHLDGRYTWIGALDSGQKSADALLIGDRIVRATIELASADSAPGQPAP